MEPNDDEDILYRACYLSGEWFFLFLRDFYNIEDSEDDEEESMVCLLFWSQSESAARLVQDTGAESETKKSKKSEKGVVTLGL